jgi:hypothetical protein
LVLTAGSVQIPITIGIAQFSGTGEVGTSIATNRQIWLAGYTTTYEDLVNVTSLVYLGFTAGITEWNAQLGINAAYNGGEEDYTITYTISFYSKEV